MRFVRQQGENDCGIATAAMVAGLSYRNARARWKIFNESGQCDGIEIFKMLRFLEAISGFVLRCKIYQRMPCLKHWVMPPGPLAVLIWPGFGYRAHWIACEHGLVYDPKEHGPCIPERALRKDFRVSAFLRAL